MTKDASISVIIPALNEAVHLGDVIASARAGGVKEIIVADGGSSDETVAIAEDGGARVVVCPNPSRGAQLHQGALAAWGDILLFLHADTVLPGDFAAHVTAALADGAVAAGAFRLCIDGPRLRLRLVERAVRWRSEHRQMPYGDQALFMRRSVYEASGGFPDEPAMEDYVFVRRLRRQGRIVTVPACVTTSARRWQRDGVVRTTVVNQCCIIGYRLGVSPERIARWRRRRGSRIGGQGSGITDSGISGGVVGGS